MRIDEVTHPLKTFLAQIRAQGLTVRTTVQADSLPQARAILDHVYGRENVQMVIDLRPSEPALMGVVGRLSGPSAIGKVVPLA
ncbi:MAG: hypothetical protein ACK45V_13960 [Brevundimonas sp.]|jgi:hypothetical protein